jgi:broad specificity phosphatase PhoE
MTLLFMAILSASQPTMARAQRAVYLVRHADKEGDALNTAGREKAGKLACLLRDAGITAIYTTQFKRTQQTAEPLKSKLEASGAHVTTSSLDLPDGLISHPDDPALVASYARSVVETLRAKNPGDIVLIVSHDTTVPAILEALGCRRKVVIQPTEFDRLFQVVPAAGDTRPPGLFELVHYAQ